MASDLLSDSLQITDAAGCYWLPLREEAEALPVLLKLIAPEKCFGWNPTTTSGVPIRQWCSRPCKLISTPCNSSLGNLGLGKSG